MEQLTRRKFDCRMKEEVARRDVDGSKRIEIFKTFSKRGSSEYDRKTFRRQWYCLTFCQAAAQTSHGQYRQAVEDQLRQEAAGVKNAGLTSGHQVFVAEVQGLKTSKTRSREEVWSWNGKGVSYCTIS